MPEFLILLAGYAALLGLVVALGWSLGKLEDRADRPAAAPLPLTTRTETSSVDGFLLFLEKVRFYLDVRNRDQRDSRGRYRVH
jgi:hypothetical protein